MNLSGLGCSLGLAIGFLATRWVLRRRRRYSLDEWRQAMRAQGIGHKGWTEWKNPPLDYRKQK